MIYAYLRVSTGKQDGQNQRVGVDALATARGLHIDEYIDDEAVSRLKYEPLITEIHNAEWAIEHYAKYYHARERDCSDSFKYLMLVNDWHSPFVALNELLKRIDTNEQLMKREKKRTGEKPAYKSRYKELRELLQKEVNKHDL